MEAKLEINGIEVLQLKLKSNALIKQHRASMSLETPGNRIDQGDLRCILSSLNHLGFSVIRNLEAYHAEQTKGVSEEPTVRECNKEFHENYNIKTIRDCFTSNGEMAMRLFQDGMQHQYKLSNINIIRFIESKLSPKYENDVFTWSQIKQALNLKDK